MKKAKNWRVKLACICRYLATGIRAWIEDVVVKENARGKGVGKLLSERAVGLASEIGAKTIDLTSRPSREAANALYKKEGFEVRETNVYRYKTSYKLLKNEVQKSTLVLTSR